MEGLVWTCVIKNRSFLSGLMDIEFHVVNRYILFRYRYTQPIHMVYVYGVHTIYMDIICENLDLYGVT